MDSPDRRWDGIPPSWGDPRNWRKYANPKIQEVRRDLIRRLSVAHCPHCGKFAEKPDTRIYRMSRTAVTLQCHNCGLQWSMTFHMIAKMARGVLQTGEGQMSELPDYRYAALAFDVPEERRPDRRPIMYEVLRRPEPPPES